MMGKRLVLSVVCLWGSLVSVFSQDAKVFDADSFNVAVTYMMPVSYPARTLSYGYGVALRNDSAFVYLPYMGRVYQPVMNDDGLRFALPAKDVKTRDVGDKGKLDSE